ncbi:hypothetical protein PIN31115_03651 [Pandoraea iniqua]|uniref:RES domain-containing protein n=2 Tax=Pandoraea iniqua TaxID=2508288 RepID=A0A5E4X559_9BURK|nr:hypothetical protein PIN31115_03651 [Pandoraea iniqua]
MRAFIQRLVGAHPLLSLQWGPGQRFRRARRLSDDDALPARVEEIAWRSGVATQGRANPAGFPVIYLADRRETAFREVGADDHRTVVAEFIIREGNDIRIVPIGELGQIQRRGRGWLSGDTSTMISGTLNACSLEEAQSLLITDMFLFECLTNAQNDYGISSEVAVSIFDKMPIVSAIAFPSRRQHGGINLAVRTQGFWDKWGVVSIQCGLATHLACGYYRFSERRDVVGITCSGGLRWDTQMHDDNSTIALAPPWAPREQPYPD